MKTKIIFLIKLMLTIYYTIMFNIFMVNNFNTNILLQISMCLVFSMAFYNLLSHQVKFVEDTKEIL
jgi:hypothetical protein